MPAAGECCVCGREASLRCSACAKRGVSLTFCSTGHQKLVWFAHKPLCNIAAQQKPLRMPDLDKYEEALVESKLFQVKYLHLRYGAGAKGVRADKVEGLLGLPENSIRKNADRFNEWLCTLESDPAVRAMVLLFIRQALRDMLVTEPGYNPLDLPASSFAAVLVTVFSDLTDARPDDDWAVDFLHRATIWAGLARILDGRAPNVQNVVDAELVRLNLRRLLLSVEEYIDLKSGGNVRRILNFFMEEFGFIAGLAGSGVHFEASGTVAGGFVPRVADVVITRPGELAPGQRLAATSSQPGVPVFAA